MANELITRNETQLATYIAPQVQLVSNRRNYSLTVGDYTSTLVRDIDFGKIPNTKTPSLFKSGAEKVLMGFGLYYDVEIVDSYKDYNTGTFYYECKATAYSPDGRVFRVGVGCCNTNEKSFGFAKSWDSANSALKKAKKRAIVDLALALGGLSDMFTQDMEDENNEKRVAELQKETDTITSKQANRIFAIAGTYEIPTGKAKELLATWGYSSSKDILVNDYDEVCNKMKTYGESLK